MSQEPANVKDSVFKAFTQRVAHYIDRTMLGRGGQGPGGKRDYYDSFGWPRTISPPEIWAMYHRGGIAARIISALPDAVWGRAPQMYVRDNEAWMKSFAKLASTNNLWQVFYRLDVMASLGRYACLVIGTNRGSSNLAAPLGKADNITYMQPYAEKDIKIHRWETNPLSPRFGKPHSYMVQTSANNGRQVVDGSTSIMPVQTAFEVHHTRVIHVARGSLENDIFGIPVYAPIWNYLLDLEKVIGSSSESYWLTAYPGLHANVDKDMDLSPSDEANLTEEVEEYMHNIRRFMRTRGVTVEAIKQQVADPKGAFEVLVTLISGATGIPKRILLGSEAGQLASTQDKGNWADRVEENRALHAIPNIVMPFLTWLDEHGVLATPLTEVEALWPDAYRMSPLERGQTAAQTARTIANIGKVIADNPDLISIKEARAIIGLSTDQNLLDEEPPKFQAPPPPPVPAPSQTPPANDSRPAPPIAKSG